MFTQISELYIIKGDSLSLETIRSQLMLKIPKSQKNNYNSSSLWVTRHYSLCQFTFDFILISAIAPFITTFQRSQVISFIHALDDVHDEVAIKNPTDTFNFGAYTDPLQLWSWIFIAIFCIVCPPFLYFTARQVEENLRMFQSFFNHI